MANDRFQPRPYQLAAEQAIRDAYAAGHRSVLLCSPVGSGKCLARGTPVLRYDGQIVPVETIKVGDLLMGPSGPKRVLSLASGVDEMYRVQPIKGDAYIVNSAHILSLTMTGGSRHSTGIADGSIVNISITDYLRTNRTFKAHAKGYRCGVEFPDSLEPMLLDPYFLGVWLGDGLSKAPAVTTADEEIKNYIIQYAAAHGLKVRVERNSLNSENLHMVVPNQTYGRGIKPNSLRNALNHYGLINNKHIPHRYKTASRADRLALLAGIIDTDGCVANGQYDLTLKSSSLMDDVIFVARSLGFSAYKRTCMKRCTNNGVWGTYYRINIGGPVDQIPCRLARKKIAKRSRQKNHLLHGITVTTHGRGEYFGFTVDGDGLFLLGDFTVTHNTVTFARICTGVHRNGKSALVLAHRRELIFQISKTLKGMGTPHGTILGGQPGLPRTPIICGAVQTVLKRLRHMRPPSLIVADEAHRCTEDSAFGQIIAAFPQARVLGVSASPQRTDRKPLSGVFDTLVHGPSVAELIAGGWLPPPEVYAPVNPDMSQVHVRRGDFVVKEAEGVMDRPHITGHATQHYKKLAPGKRAIVFCVSIKHAEHVAEEFRRAGFDASHVDGTMTDTERARRLRDFERGTLPILTTVDLCNEGLDIPGIEAAILLRPTESVIVHIQQMGRAMRPAPGKSRALIIDACGNVQRHGLPDAPRTWTLDGIVKEPTEKVARVMTCRACFACYPPARVCPRCGAVPEVRARKVDQVEGELGLVTDGAEYDEPASDTLKDMTRQWYTLRAIAKQRGYENPDSWAFKIVSARLAAKKGSVTVDELAATTVGRESVMRAMSKEDPVEPAA